MSEIVEPFDRTRLRESWTAPEAAAIRGAIEALALDVDRRKAIEERAAAWVRAIRERSQPTLMEAFLDAYGLSTEEGVGLMCLAEALLRVPDAPTIDELIKDKIEPSNWSAHLGKSSSPLVNASTWALMLTGRVLDDDPHAPAAALRGLIRRAGEPVVRAAVQRAMRELGKQFVLGETIEDALAAAEADPDYAHSFDMLGEAARTHADAERYFQSYANALEAVAARAGDDVSANSGLSVKLSALHPRYETTHRAQVIEELAPRLLSLAKRAAEANVGLTVDAEEQDRLELSLDVIAKVLPDPALAGWRGFGVVVQAYGRRASAVIDILERLARAHERKLAIRLVKGAYWDSEIKLAQEMGLPSFPVFTRKASTDVAWLACAKILLERRDRFYPQFATHNAHSIAAVLEMAGEERGGFEFQRLHGMGEALHETARKEAGTRHRIYAPVGAHEDLLAYLVRRLLENGANSSFVHQIVDVSIPPEAIAADPIAEIERLGDAIANPKIRPPEALFGAERPAARGWLLGEPASIEPLIAEREAFSTTRWRAAPLLADGEGEGRPAREVFAPHDPSDRVGEVIDASEADIARALDEAHAAAPVWAERPAPERAAILRAAADRLEENAPELFALLAREAGKTLDDAIAELREAVDFLRYYACAGERSTEGEPRGVILCVSPWNFPLAIFTGQIAGALAAGCVAIAKPAEQTPLIAHRAVELLREAGVPARALQFLPGDGPTVGGPLSRDPRLGGICFTGSSATAEILHRALAENAGARAVLIAETGGLNAMLVDTTALTEQAVRDIVASAFRSAGQRCSALRVLYVQKEAEKRLVTMLAGAAEALEIGDPWRLSTDVGPVIDQEAKAAIESHIAEAEREGRLKLRLEAPSSGCFVGPAIIEVSGIEAVEREVFGPVLHVARYEAKDVAQVVDAIEARGYGLTFGLHTRIDDRVEAIVERLRVGNAYVNRNQIGAVVGSQPFGGEGLSGAGPKAGGPLYVPRFRRPAAAPPPVAAPSGPAADRAELERALEEAAKAEAAWAARRDRIAILREALADAPSGARRAIDAAASFDPGPFVLPGPTGETNKLSYHPKGPALCLGPDPESALDQAIQALAAGCGATLLCPGAREISRALRRSPAPALAIDGTIDPDWLERLSPLAVVAAVGSGDWPNALRCALARRAGPIIALETDRIAPERYWLERHLCVDTTAAGGNAQLMASVD